jgi:hypothetical protein
MFWNISIGFAIVWGYTEFWWPLKNKQVPSAFYRLCLLCLFLNFPNMKQIASFYNRSVWKWSIGKASPIRFLSELMTCIFSPCPHIETGAWEWSIIHKSKHISSICKDKIVWGVTILAYHLWMICYHLWMMPSLWAARQETWHWRLCNHSCTRRVA